MLNSAALGQRDPELRTRPNKYAAPQGFEELPGVLRLHGYQNYEVELASGVARAIGGGLVAKEAALRGVLQPRYFAQRSVLDLGGNNGFFSLMALRAGARAATVVEIDDACVDNVHRLKLRVPDLPLEARHENIETWTEPADAVLALALVHWIYSCTAQLRSLERAAELLSRLTRDFLIVEWVDPQDPLVRSYRHTEVDGDSGAYTFEAFRDALLARFRKLELLAELTPSRRLYLASRRPIPDLSWPEPMPVTAERVLTARQLWSVGGQEFWSRVFRDGSTKYKQSTPALAERELAAARILDVPIELVDRTASAWVLKMPFVEGESLDERAAREPILRREALGIGRQLVHRVSALRRAGIVHRDLHPSNVIVAADGVVHLIDFAWALLPGLREITPPQLGTSVDQPATHSTLQVRPPESSGDDLFAVGRIIGWLAERAKDPTLGLLGTWLGHPDLSQRLTSERLAAELLDAVIAADERGALDGEDPANLVTALLQFAAAAAHRAELVAQARDEAHALEVHASSVEREREVARAERERDAACAEKERADHERDEARAGMERAMAERDATAAHARNLEEQIFWMRKSHFWQAHDRWFGLKALLGLRVPKTLP